MYSMKSFPIKTHTLFKKNKDIYVMDTFATFYGEVLINFLCDEQKKYNQHSIDILQKISILPFFEFIIFTMKQIELHEVKELL